APALHRAGEALALGDAGNVDHLAGDEVIGADVRAEIEQPVLVDAELGDADLGLDLRLAERGALRLGDILGLRLARAELDGGVAVPVRLAAADDLQLVQLQDGHWHVPTVRLEQAGHSDLLRDHAGAHDQNSSTEAHGKIPGCVKPIPMFACPAWASASSRKRRGRSPELVSGGILVLVPRRRPGPRSAQALLLSTPG